jgi:uncharacterized protein
MHFNIYMYFYGLCVMVIDHRCNPATIAGLTKPKLPFMSSSFIIVKRNNGDYQFNLTAGNGETILSSEGYTTRINCHSGIESVKMNAADKNKYDRKRSSNGQYYFTLEATNGKVIGVSELYENESGVINGIDSVRINAPYAIVQDTTI